MSIRERRATRKQPLSPPGLDGEGASVERRRMDVTLITTLTPAARVALPVMVERIAHGFDPIEIVLFGSQARGGAK